MSTTSVRRLRAKPKAVLAKLDRIRAGHPIRTLDLFAGCGGLSLGFHAAGFAVSTAVELDPIAIRSHAWNFFKDDSAHAVPIDITAMDPDELAGRYDLGRDVAGCVDVIVGGPPCQAFARVGRAKLREIEEHPRAFKNDARGNLYLRYLHYVQELKPLALLVENVPDMMNYGGHNIAEEVSEVLEGLGYVSRYTLLNSAFYGVPQMRERMFLIAYRRELEATVSFPRPTHHVELPAGYQGSRDVALKSLRNGAKHKRLLSDDTHYDEPPGAADDLPPAVTSKQAIEDLPPITLHLEGKLRKVTQRLDSVTLYPKGRKLNSYAKLMRGWPGFESRDGIPDHVIRYLPRDYQIFRVMNPGDQYPQAYKHAIELFHSKLKELESTGRKLRKGSTEYESLKKSIVPPYDATKFPNKWRKMEPDLPARTLMAHIGKDTYSHIHYDSEQARTVSVREAARLQSFPDGFKFVGSMNAAFRQIGNAVPPLMAKAIADEMLIAIRGTK